MAIIAYFAVAIAGIAVFVSWSVRQNMDLVRKDYYVEGVQFQKHLDQLNRAREQNWMPGCSYDRARDIIVISLSHPTSSLFDNVQFYRPSDVRLDKNIALSLSSAGVQEIDAHAFPAGICKVRINWTSNANEYSS